MIANLSGPYEGKWHNNYMLAESDLLTQLQEQTWLKNCPLNLCGDPAYPLSLHLQAPF